jgi:hypothetical protein
MKCDEQVTVLFLRYSYAIMFSPNDGCGSRIMPRPELVEGLCELMTVYTIFDP